MSNQDVVVSDKDGKKLCKVHCPQGWNHFVGVPIPLPGVVVIHHTEREWTSPEAVVRWAWHQALETHETYKERGVTDLSRELYINEEQCNPTPCIVCKTLSIKPARRLTLYGNKPFGVQCTNKICTMYHVTVPWQMLVHLKDVPTQYIPKGFYVRR